MKKMHNNIHGRTITAYHISGKSHAALALAISLMCSYGTASANSGGYIETESGVGPHYIGSQGLNNNTVFIDDTTGIREAYGGAAVDGGECQWQHHNH